MAKAKAGLVIPEVLEFLAIPTPQAWLEAACSQLDVLLLDHLHCEYKAAAFGMKMLKSYASWQAFSHKLTQLIREEVLHFEQVQTILHKRHIKYAPLPAGRYAKCLHQASKDFGATKQLDAFIIAALIEARSCERFYALAEVLEDKELAGFFRFLAQSESRHFLDYLEFGKILAQESDWDFNARVAELKKIEQDLITSPDSLFRFHSGMPIL